MEKIQTTSNNQEDIQPKIDLDAFFKTLLSGFFQEGIELINPELYEAVDWTTPVVFLEQELINALKGRFKIKGKRKFTDKLAKLRLKSGTDYYVITHVEAQHEPEDAFNKRMYIYRCLINLWLDIDDITAIAIFTGAPPSVDSLSYNHKCFDTEISYRYRNYIIAEQNEAELLKSDNPFAIAVLATLYTYQTVNDAERRFAFKRKVFELAQKKNIPIDKMARLLTFVNDFMYLPKTLEAEFQFESKSFSNFLIDDMTQEIEVHSESTMQIIDTFIFKTTGKTIAQYRAEAAAIDARIRKENEARRKATQAENRLKRAERQVKLNEKKMEAMEASVEAASAKLKTASAKAEAERAKAEAERAKAIFNFYSKVGLSKDVIASTLNVKLEYVDKIIAEKLKK